MHLTLCQECGPGTRTLCIGLRTDDFNAETEVFVSDAIPVSDVKLQQRIDSQDQDEVCKTLKVTP